MAEHHDLLAARLRNDPASSTRSPLMAPGSAPTAGTVFDDDFPEADWRSGIKTWAEGGNASRFFPSAEESMVRSANTALSKAMTSGAPDMRAAHTGRALEDLLSRPSPVVHDHPDQQRLQQSMIVLESFVANSQKSGNPRDTLLAVAALSPSAQRQLFMADQLSGNRLYQQMHQAKTSYAAAQVGKEVGARDLPDLEKVFSDVRVESQNATTLNIMNQRDKTGMEARLTTQFLEHLENTGVSWQAQKAFADKLAFKAQISGTHGTEADLAPMARLKNVGSKFKGDVEGRFTGQLFATLAESPGVEEKELAKALDLPQAELVRVTGHSAMRGHEGDRRVMQVVSEAVRGDVLGKGKKDLEPLHGVLTNVSGGRFSAEEFAEQASQGKDIGAIETTLRSNADKQAIKDSTEISALMTKVLPKLEQRRDYLRDTLIDKLDEPEKTKARNQYEELDAFVKKYPLEQFTAEKIGPVVRQFGANVTRVGDPFASSGLTPTSDTTNTASFRGFMAFTQQLSGHQKSLEDPALYGQGLDKVTPVLPTAGRDLRDCPWLGSTAADMARSAALVKGKNAEYSLKNAPIIVIDQSDAKNKSLWEKNDAYCKELERQHAASGLKVVHVSMEDVNRLAGPGLKKMFDTTGQDFAGYGGARNMAYLLAPVIRQCEIEGKDWRTMTAEEALPLIQKHALDKSTTKLFMGDDTDQISEGTMLAKSVLAREHATDYGLVATQRDGRNTMNVSEGQTNSPSLLLTGGIDTFTGALHQGNGWNTTGKAAGMGCTFGDSRFCLDLPLGAEEKQHEAMKSSIDRFSKSTHLSGDRQKDLGEYFSSHLAYTNSSGMVKSLVKEGELPWNKSHRENDQATNKPKFDSLKGVLEFASDPAQKKLAQQNFFQNMAAWRGDNSSGALSLDISPAEMLQTLQSRLDEVVNTKQEATTALREATEAKKRAETTKPVDAEAVKKAQGEIEEATRKITGAEESIKNLTKNKNLLEPALRAAPGDIKTANGAIVDYYLKQHPELKPEDREQLEKVRGAYEKAGAEIKLGRKYMDKLMDELVPATDTTLAGSKLSEEDLKKALKISLAGEPPDKAATAIAKVKTDMERDGVRFNDNRFLRDIHLITESLGGEGFANLSQKLHTPAPKIEVRQDVVVTPRVESVGVESVSSVVESPKPGVISKDDSAMDLGGLGESLQDSSSSLVEELPKEGEKEVLTTREALLRGGHKFKTSSDGTGVKVAVSNL